MQEEAMKILEKHILSGDNTFAASHYLREAERRRMPLDMLQDCENLTLVGLEKSTERNLRQLRRLDCFAAAECLYMQINPQKRWSISMGLVMQVSNWDRELLYRAQQEMLEGRGSEEAARIYYESLNCPWEDAAENYLVYRTLWTLRRVLSKERPPMLVLAGISREKPVACLWQPQTP